jgi:hypothetical protein
MAISLPDAADGSRISLRSLSLQLRPKQILDFGPIFSTAESTSRYRTYVLMGVESVGGQVVRQAHRWCLVVLI